MADVERQLPTGYDDFGVRKCGPYLSSGDNVYYVSAPDSGVSVDVLKTADPSSTAFAVQDASDNPTTSSTAAIRGSTALLDFDVFQVSDVLHVATLSRTDPAMGDSTWYIDYFTFDMSTDQWTTTGGARGAVDSASGGNADIQTGVERVKIAIRADDSDVCIYGFGAVNTQMGSDYATVYQSYYDTSWNTGSRADNGGASAAHQSVYGVSNAIPSGGNAGNYTVTWVGGSDGGRPVTGASHTLGTVGAIAIAMGANTDSSRGHFVYDDGGTYRGVFPNPGNAGASVYTFDPTSSDPFGAEGTESDITGTDSNENFHGLLVNDDADDRRYWVYIDSGTPEVLKYVYSDNQGSWGNNTTIKNGGNNTFLPWGYANIYTRGGTKVLAFLWRDSTAGESYYYEVDIDTGGGTSVTPGTGTLTLTGQTPTVDVTTNATVTPSTGALSLTGYSLLLATTIATSTGNLSLTGYAPTLDVTTNVEVSPSTGTLSLTGQTPTVATTANVWLTPTTGTLDLTGYAPTVDAGANVSLDSLTGQLSLTGYAPDVAATANVWLDPVQSTLSLTGYAPAVATTANVDLSPSTGTLTLTGFVPTLVLPVSVATSTGSLSLAGYAPTTNVTASANPTTGTLSLTGYAPAAVATTNYTGVPATGALSLTGYAPTVDAGADVGVTPSTGALTLTGQTPTATVRVRQSELGTSLMPTTWRVKPFAAKTASPDADLRPGKADLTLTGYAPTLSVPVSVTPSTATLTLTGQSVTVAVSTVNYSELGTTVMPAAYRTKPFPSKTADANNLTVATGTLTITGQTPVLTVSGAVEALPTVGALTLTGYAPTVEIGVSGDENTYAEPLTGALSLTGYAPSLTQTNNVFLEPATGSLTLTGYVPTLSLPQTFTPSTGSLTLTGQAPSVSGDTALTPSTGTLTLTGQVPDVLYSLTLTPATGTLTLSGYAPSLAGLATIISPSTASLAFTGYAPRITNWTDQDTAGSTWVDQTTGSGSWIDQTTGAGSWSDV